MTSVRTIAPSPIGTESPPELDEGAVLVPAGLKQGVSLPHQVAALAVWPLLEQVLAFGVGLVDLVAAGHWLSTEVLNAVGASVYVLWLMGLLMGAASVGATALISRAAGAGRWRRANAVLAQAMILAAAIGALMLFFFYFGAPWVSRLSGLNDKSQILCDQYLQILAFGVPFAITMFIGAACLRGSGDTRTAFLTMVIVNIVNVTGCVLLVAPWSPLGGHGIDGLALAMLSAWVVGSVCMLTVLFRGAKLMRLQLRFLRPQWRLLTRIVRIGVPNLLEGGGMWVGNYLMIMIVGRLSETAIGAHFVTMRIESMSYMPGFALGIAAATLTGQYLGVGDARNARRAAWWCWSYGAGLMTLLGVVFVLWPDVLVNLVTNKEVMHETCPPLLRLIGYVQLPLASAFIFSSVHRGAGDTRTAMCITYGSIFLVRVPLVYYLAVTLNLGLQGVWLGMSIELVVRGALFLASFLRGGWARVTV